MLFVSSIWALISLDYFLVCFPSGTRINFAVESFSVGDSG